MELFRQLNEEASDRPVLALVTSSSCSHCRRLKEEGGVDALRQLCDGAGCGFRSVEETDPSFNAFVDGIRLPGFPTIALFSEGEVTFHHPSSFLLASVGVREGCPYCRRARVLLSEAAIPAMYHDAPQGVVPQVVFHEMGRKGGKHVYERREVGGSDRLEEELKKERKEGTVVPSVERCQGNFCRARSLKDKKRRAEERAEVRETRRKTREKRREERLRRLLSKTDAKKRRRPTPAAAKETGTTRKSGRRPKGNRGVW